MSLFSFLKKKPQRAIGVEITNRSIRWAEITIGKNAFEIEAHGSVDTTYNPWGRSISALDEMRKDFSALKFRRTLPIVCVLPESLTHTAYLTIAIEDPAVATATIEQAIESYIVDHDTFVASDTVCIYDILDQDTAQATIVITLYQIRATEVIKNVFTEMGYRDIIFTPMHDALQALSIQQAPALLFCVSDTHTSIIQMVDNQLRGYARVTFGARDVANHISDVVGPERAARVYARYGMKSNHRDPDLYGRIIERALPIIQQAERMIHSIGHDHTLSILGEYSDIPGFDTFLARELRRSPTLLNVQQRFVSPDIRLPVIDAHDMLRFAPALGAAVDYLESR